MHREKSSEAIVLKKMAYGEADEIVTFFTRDFGKIRALATSVKKSTSRMQHAVQQLAKVNITVTSGKQTKLPKLIGIQLKDIFKTVREEQALARSALVATELILIATPDEQVNTELYDYYINFLNALNFIGEKNAVALLVKFKTLALESLGFAVSTLEASKEEVIGFSSHMGGFVKIAQAPTADVVTWSLYELFLKIKDMDWKAVGELNEQLDELNHFLSLFISYQLERELKTERF
jgi:DNA repair protein RecO (recombination protein O)